MTTFANQIRRIVLAQSMRAHVGHIASALSIADLLGVLYEHVLRIPDPTDPERDRFILSKGHAALALYAALHLRGWLTQQDLDTYCADDSLLGVHPERDLVGVDFATGSLGHGLSMATGAALAAKKLGSARRAFVLLSDAECNEGSVWEAAMFAAHHRLDNLVAVIDANGQQALGYTRDVINTEPMLERWASFGWDAVECDGHDTAALLATFRGAVDGPNRPHVIVARTVAGHGVSFMERLVKWHYLPMSQREYEVAEAEIFARDT